MTHPLLYGPYGSTALPYIDRLPVYGANAIWFHGFDADAFDACAAHDIAACVEFKTFRADFNARPDLIPIGVDGKPIRYGRLVQGVCLSKQDFLEETEANLRAGLATYAPRGIWLDYLTYAGWFETPTPDLQESCFCADCIANFNEATGLDLTTPDAILAQAPAAWAAHKCARIAGFAAHYAEIIHDALPGCIIGAYMCPWTPDEFDHALTRIFAQDYHLLAPYIDIFTPLIYCEKSGRPPSWGKHWLSASPAFVPEGHPVQLILDVLDAPATLQETAKSKNPSWGIQLFGGGPIFADDDQARIFAAAVDAMRTRAEQLT